MTTMSVQSLMSEYSDDSDDRDDSEEEYEIDAKTRMKKKHSLDKILKIRKARFFQQYRFIMPSVIEQDEYIRSIHFYMAQLRIKNYDSDVLTIYFKSKENIHQYMFRSMDIRANMDINEYIEKLYKEASTIAHGSDGINEDIYTVDFAIFDIFATKKTLQGHGICKESDCFKTLEIEHPKPNLCGLDCLNYVLKQNGKEPYPENIYVKEQLYMVSNMINFIFENQLNIAIIEDLICYNGSVVELNEHEFKKYEHYQNSNWHTRLFKPNLSEANYAVINARDEGRVQGPLFYMIYNTKHKHFFMADKIELSDNIYFSDINMLCKLRNNKAVFLHSSKSKYYDECARVKMIESPRLTRRYIFFDFECVINFNERNVNKPYSLNIFNCDDLELQYLNRCEEVYKTNRELYNEESTNIDIHDQPIDIFDKDILPRNLNINIDSNFTHTRFRQICLKCNKLFLGYDCCRHFYNYLNENHRKVIYVFIGFNNSNYDNYILYDQWSHITDEDNKITELMINKGQILNFRLFNLDHVFDMRKHVVGSLKYNCKAFGLELCKKVGDFSFEEMQKKYDDGELLDFIKDNEKLAEYNKFDCLSLALIYFRYEKSIKQIPEFNKYMEDNNKHLTDFFTLGMLTNSVHENNQKKQEIIMPKFTVSKSDFIKKQRKMLIKGPKKCNKVVIEGLFEKYNDTLQNFYNLLLRSRVAGRCQLFNGTQKVVGRIHSMDACSLYPYICCILDCMYPCDELSFGNTDKFIDDDKLRYYMVDVDQTNLTIKYLAEKTADGNNWIKDKLCNILISSPELKYLTKIGCAIKYLGDYYEFSGSLKSCELFSWMLPIMGFKNNEDMLKAKNDPSYNNSMREVYKLIMNIISGKANQGLSLTDRKVIKNELEYLELKAKSEKINTIMIMNDERIHVTYDLKQKDNMRKCKPIFVGSLIYSYARMYMHEHVYTKVDKEHIFYTDTDSCKMDEIGFAQWKQYASNHIVPHWKEVEEIDERYKEARIYNENFKVFGSFEDEYKNNGDNMISYFEMKKLYTCIDVEASNKYRELLNKCNNDNEKVKIIEKLKEIEHTHMGGVSDSSIILTEEEALKLKKMKKRELYEVYINNKNKKISDNPLKFFETLHNNKNADVLTFSMTKKYNNNKHDVKINDKDRMAIDCYKIISNYAVKHINVHVQS